MCALCLSRKTLILQYRKLGESWVSLKEDGVLRLTHDINPASNVGRPSQRLRIAVQNALIIHQTMPLPGNTARPALKHVPGG